MANSATVEDIENRIRELCKLPPAQQSAEKSQVHKQSPRLNDQQSKNLDYQLNQSTSVSAEGKGRKSKKGKNSQSRRAEIVSISSESLSEPTGSKMDTAGKEISQTNFRERKIVDVSQKESPRQGRPRSSQQRGKRGGGGGRQMEASEKQTEVLQSTDSPAKKKSIDMNLFDKELQEKFERDGMFTLKKKSVRFPNARYYCRLCSFHCMSDEHCEKHMQDTRHKRLKAIKSNDIILNNLPAPTPAHCAAVTALLQQVISEQSLSAEGLKQCMSVQTSIKEFTKQHFPELELTLYGSTVSGFALKDSDVNITITEYDSPIVLKHLYNMLKANDSGFSDVTSDFTAELPYLLCHSDDVTCRINLATVAACKTSQLLAVYAAIDPRVVQIGVAFRYWAKLCHLDRQHEGTLPAYAFTVMTVYFLQQCQPPVLPVLHELVQPHEDEKEKDLDLYFTDIDNLGDIWQCHNTSCVGQLWIQMLQFYALKFNNEATVISLRQKAPMTRDEKKWGRHKLAIQDPFLLKRNIARTLSGIQIYEYICDRLRAAYDYFGIARTLDGPLFTNIDPNFISNQLCENLKKLAEDVVSSEDKTSDTRSEADHPEKPASAQSDRAANNSVSDTSVATELRTDSDLMPPVESTNLGSGERKLDNDEDKTESYLPSTTGAGDTPECKVTPLDSRKSLTGVHAQAGSIATDVIRDVVLDFHVSAVINQLSTDTLGNVITPRHVETPGEFPVQFLNTDYLGNLNVVSPTDGVSTKDVTVDMIGSSQQSDSSHTCNSCPVKVVPPFNVPLGKNGKRVYLEEIEKVTEKEFVFLFTPDTLFDGKGPALVCNSCKKEGHLEDNCPDDLLPPIMHLPPLTPLHRDMLEEVLRQVQEDFSPSQHEMDVRHRAIKELQSYIQRGQPTAHLNLFGSSCNGFGFRNSDMDICMTLADATADSLNCADIMEQLTRMLKANRDLYNVVAIPTAKVPIVKFRHRPAQLDGDISLYNTLAQQNTQMLSAYANIDPRVKTIGYAMKVLAKVCEIGDASRGSLSSYAYILMVLYYLQHTDPPVLPVLQELYNGKKPERIIDGWNAWFYDDVSSLRDVWPGLGQNKQSTADLWIGLLRFYTEEFNLREFVISVGRKAPLTRFEKLWNGKCIAIEDPFNYSHNLGGALSRRMNAYIMKALIKSRNVFGLHFRSQHPHKSLAAQLFDSKLLTDGSPPNDKGCRICGKIGHIAKECPKNRHSRQAVQWRDGGDRGGSGRRQGTDQTALIRGQQQQQQQQQPQQQHRHQQQRQPPQRGTRPVPVLPNRHGQPLHPYHSPQQRGVPHSAPPQQMFQQQQQQQQYSRHQSQHQHQPMVPMQYMTQPQYHQQQQQQQRQPQQQHPQQQHPQQAQLYNHQMRGRHSAMDQRGRPMWQDPHSQT